MRHLPALLTLSALVLVSACGSDDGLKCGAGTIASGNTCVPAAVDADATDATDASDGDVAVPDSDVSNVEDVAPDRAEEATPEVEVTPECVDENDCLHLLTQSCQVRVCEDGKCKLGNAENDSVCQTDSCRTGEECHNGTCGGGSPKVTCFNKECGTDSCGKSCGTCEGDERCNDGSCEAACAGAKRVFISATRYTADLAHEAGVEDGIAAADALCALAAESGDLGGQWVAWISTDAVDAIDRIADVGPWKLVGSCNSVFARRVDIITSGPRIEIDHDEHGQPSDSGTAWTGTSSTGRGGELDCADWTNGTFGEGLVGISSLESAITGSWTDSVSHPCNFKNSLICFEL